MTAACLKTAAKLSTEVQARNDMCEKDLGMSSDWVLKGQGNANAVFGFSGANTSLVSHGTTAVQPSIFPHNSP